LPKVPANGRAKLEKPASDSFIGNIQTALREVIFYISIAQREPSIKPYSVADDLRREAVALEGYVVNPDATSRPPLRTSPVNVTMPYISWRIGQDWGVTAYEIVG